MVSHAQDMGVAISEAAPAALRCPGRELPDESDHWLFDETWVTFNASEAELQAPVSVAVDAQCNVYVVDNAQSRVVKLDQSGALLSAWGDATRFSGLVGIAVDPRGEMFLADAGARRVVKLGPEGDVQLAWAPTCAGVTSPCVEIPDAAFRKLAVAADGSGRLYILADDAVLQVSTDGPLLKRWGASTAGSPAFTTPTALAVDADGNLFVADVGNGRVQKLSPQGQVLAVFSTQANRPGQASSAPRGLAVDRGGNVLMALDGLAIDGQGNRFLADPARGRVVAALNVAVPARSNMSD